MRDPTWEIKGTEIKSYKKMAKLSSKNLISNFFLLLASYLPSQ